MRVFRPLIRGLGLLLLAWTGTLTSSAMTVVAPTFSALVAQAESVARVEVTGQTSKWETSPSGKAVIHTYVQFRVIKQLKGVAQTTLSLRFLGGRVGTSVMEIPDMPAFVTGRRYIVFVAGNGRAFCPLVGIMYGTYTVTADSDGVDRIRRSNGAALPSAAAVKEPNDQSERVGTTAMTREDFESAIAQEVSRASSR